MQQVAAQLPWFHGCVLIDRAKDARTREWYARQAIEHGWSRSMLVVQIESRLHERAGKALSNFKATLLPATDTSSGLDGDDSLVRSLTTVTARSRASTDRRIHDFG